MARINLENSLWTDIRFLKLGEKLGRRAAIGTLVELWLLAQNYWARGLKIPLDVYELHEFPTELRALGWAIDASDGVEARGAERHFAWLDACVENGKKGGRPKKIQSLTKPKPFSGKPNSNPADPKGQPPTPPPAPVPSLAPALLKEEVRKKEEVNTLPKPEFTFAPASPPTAPKKAKSEPDPRNRLTWESYAKAYVQRYATEPVRNGVINTQIANIVKRLGDDSVPVIAFYVGHNHRRYVERQHPVGLCLMDAEGLFTQWKSNFKVTSQSAVQVEKTDHYREQMKRIAARAEAQNG